MKWRTTVCALVSVCLISSGSLAQDKERFGLVVEAPTSVGVLWGISGPIAIRPDFSFSQTEAHSFNAGSETRIIGAGVSGLVYLRKWDDLRMYVSPRFEYTRYRFLVLQAGFNGVVTEQKSVQATYSGAASLGGQYALGSRFGVFAEAGYEYRRNNATNGGGLGGVPTFRNHTWTTRSVVGAIIRF